MATGFWFGRLEPYSGGLRVERTLEALRDSVRYDPGEARRVAGLVGAGDKGAVRNPLMASEASVKRVAVHSHSMRLRRQLLPLLR